MSYPGAQQQQYPAAPPPGYYPPHPPSWGGAPVRRRRSRWLTVGLPVGGVLLLGGCATAVGLLINAAADSLGPAVQAADAYASAVVDERWDDAHDLLCAQDQAAVTPEDMAAHYAGPDRTGHSIDGVQISSWNGEETAQASIAYETADGLTDHEALPMVSDGEAWRPCP